MHKKHRVVSLIVTQAQTRMIRDFLIYRRLELVLTKLRISRVKYKSRSIILRKRISCLERKLIKVIRPTMEDFGLLRNINNKQRLAPSI